MTGNVQYLKGQRFNCANPKEMGKLKLRIKSQAIQCAIQDVTLNEIWNVKVKIQVLKMY